MTSDKQKHAFTASEGNSYFARNRERLTVPDDALSDPVVAALHAAGAKPAVALEVGCGNGWRLETIRRMFGTRGVGLDPSAGAVAEGVASYPELELFEGTADDLPFDDNAFDLVIFGFCLYLCDRTDLFRIVAEADRVLRDHGTLVIFDFSPDRAYRNAYEHKAGLYSYKMNHEELFLASPAYSLVSKKEFTQDGSDPADPDDRLAVVVLHKDVAAAFPDRGTT